MVPAGGLEWWPWPHVGVEAMQHPRLRWLGSLEEGERFTRVVSSALRVAVATDRGRVATWTDTEAIRENWFADAERTFGHEPVRR